MLITGGDLPGLSLAAAMASLNAPRLFAANGAVSLHKNSIIIDGVGFPGGLSMDEAALLSPGKAGIHLLITQKKTQNPVFCVFSYDLL